MTREELKELGAVTVYVMVVMGVAALALLAAGCLLERQACQRVELETAHRTEWFVFGGCFVEVDGAWVPKGNWRVGEKGGAYDEE